MGQESGGNFTGNVLDSRTGQVRNIVSNTNAHLHSGCTGSGVRYWREFVAVSGFQGPHKG
jgi:hypothetical protein